MAKSGSGSKTGKLTKLDRMYIKIAMYEKPIKTIAKELGVHPSTICRFRSGEHWSK